MDIYIYIIIGLLTIIFIFVLISFIKYANIKDITKKLEISKKNIGILLGKKINVLSRASNSLKKDFKIDFDISTSNNLEEDYDFGLDKNTNNLYKSFIKIVDDNKLNGKKKIESIIDDYIDINEDMLGLKFYYNMNADLLNNLFKRKFYKIILKMLKIKKIDKFDVEKISELEILKN